MPLSSPVRLRVGSLDVSSVPPDPLARLVAVEVARELAPMKGVAPPVLVVLQPASVKSSLRVAVPPVRVEAGVLLLLFAPRKLPRRSPLPSKRILWRVPSEVSNFRKSCWKIELVDRGVVRPKPRVLNGFSVVLEIVWVIVLNASALPAQRRVRGRTAVRATLRTLRGPGLRTFLATGKEVGDIDQAMIDGATIALPWAVVTGLLVASAFRDPGSRPGGCSGGGPQITTSPAGPSAVGVSCKNPGHREDPP